MIHHHAQVFIERKRLVVALTVIPKHVIGEPRASSRLHGDPKKDTGVVKFLPKPYELLPSLCRRRNHAPMITRALVDVKT